MVKEPVCVTEPLITSVPINCTSPWMLDNQTSVSFSYAAFSPFCLNIVFYSVVSHTSL